MFPLKMACGRGEWVNLWNCKRDKSVAITMERLFYSSRLSMDSVRSNGSQWTPRDGEIIRGAGATIIGPNHQRNSNEIITHPNGTRSLRYPVCSTADQENHQNWTG